MYKPHVTLKPLTQRGENISSPLKNLVNNLSEILLGTSGIHLMIEY